MTTAPRPKPAPPQRSIRLMLMIQETQYTVRRVACDPLIGARAFRLLKEDGTLYDVIQTPFGPECDCPDFVFRRLGIDPAGCKHVQALVALGLIEPS
ncbi:MAG: hypothetical protein IRY99_06625 [Isosphaeraceae bacterium]|nr:hypothetical protein [Isosphaeraceae bacterium]